MPIGKAISVDICGGSVTKINARVKVEDADSLSSRDLINNFNCFFDINPNDIVLMGGSQRDIRWGARTECTGEKAIAKDKIRLFAKQRAYEISRNDCK